MTRDHSACPLAGRSSWVLQAGIAGNKWNLDSGEIQEWAYTRVTEENPGWLGGFDGDIDRDMPLRWLTQVVGTDVLMAGRPSRP